MSNLTGTSDIVLQLTEDALSRCYRGMHAAGVIRHHLVGLAQGTRIELTLNAPALTIANPGTDSYFRVVLSARGHYFDRVAGDAADVGNVCVADLKIRARVRFDSGNPALLDADSRLIFDWDETNTNDISLHGVAAAQEAIVRTRIRDLLVEAGRGDGPGGWLSAMGFARLSLTPILPLASSGVLSIAVAKTLPAQAVEPTTAFVQHDWALTASAPVVMAQLRDAIKVQLGQLPPPWGTGSVVIDQSGGNTVTLESLAVALVPGAIVFSGTVKKVSSGLFPPPVSAQWTTLVTLSVDLSGAVRATASMPTVAFNEFYAQLVNFFSLGQLEKAAGAAFQAAFIGTLGAVSPQGLLGDLVKDVASAGSNLMVALDPSVVAVEVRADGVVLQGALIDRTVHLDVQSRIDTLASPTPAALVLNAGQSWSPGAEMTEISFDFGDGQSLVTQGIAARVVASHAYAPGNYTSCVTVNDSLGRGRTTCVAVSPGLLLLTNPNGTITHAGLRVCSGKGTYYERFLVTSSSTPVQGVLVTAQGNGWSLAGTTDEEGQVTLALPEADLRARSFAVPKPDSLHLGACRISANLAGYVTASEVLWLYDCTGAAELKIQAELLREQMLDRLAGYAALRELKQRGDLGNTLPPLNPLDPTPVDPIYHINPRLTQGTRLLFAMDLVTRLTALVADAGPLSAASILGVEDGPGNSGAVLQRLNHLWGMVDRMAADFDGRP